MNSSATSSKNGSVGQTGAWMAENGTTSVQLLAVNHDGVPLGKHLSAAKFLSIAHDGTPVSDVAFGIDLGGEFAVGWDWGSWRTGNIADILIRPDLGTLSNDPDNPGCASVIGEFTDVDGNPLPVCYRSLLRRMTDAVAERGFEVMTAVELEFTVFEQSLAQARSQGYRGLTPLGGDGMLTYQLNRSPDLARFMQAAVQRLEALGIPWEAWSTETAAGQVEVNVSPSDPLTTADRITRAKLALREVAAEQGRSVTFMARADEGGYGAGMHVNQSLWRDGTNAFHDPRSPSGQSEVMRHWLGGLMATLPAAMSFLTPNLNSYRRLAELTGPPTTVTWDEDNKTVAIRTIARDPKAARIEHRVPCADSNIYLALAVMLAGGLVGLDAKLDPPPPFRAMAWALPAGAAPKLPGTIRGAARALAADQALVSVLSEEVVRYWLGSREWEWTIFHLRGGEPDTVGDYELARYFERV